MMELEELAISNRETAKIMIKRRLPQILEKLNSKILIQQKDDVNVSKLLKVISMKRYSKEPTEQDV